MNSNNKGYWRYWGKARPEFEDEMRYHLLPYHCLDVAAVGAAYLAHHAALRANWAARLQIPEETFTNWFVFFLSQHDLGKFSYRFQGLRADLSRTLENEQPVDAYSLRHDTLGYHLWTGKIWPLAVEQAWFGGSADRASRRLFEAWARIVTGHHGQPPKTSDQPPWLNEHFTERDINAALQFSADCAEFMLPHRNGDLPGREIHERLTPLSWWLAGMAVLCDWLGSSEEYFDYRTRSQSDEPLPLKDYWERFALPQADNALRAVGLLPHRPRPQTLAGLFENLGPPAQPTPLQQAAATIPWASAPQLFILEDVTGAGKTEAALMLAHRLITGGLADGFYFGLPTMATSNAMFRRIVSKRLDEKLYEDKPNRVLAHSASRLEPVLEALLSGGKDSDADYHQDDESGGNQRFKWFSDSRKKALLADIGIGTLDQALLAVLYTKHQSLRLFGLARKVLIVDEVHACDAYMLRLLETLLEFHAAAGGCAILLSATLPRKTREILAAAYRQGLGCAAPALSCCKYPLLTRVGTDLPDEIPLATRPEVERSVEIDWLHSVEDAIAVLLAAKAKNRCACWIRNTVDDAIAAFELLQKAGVSDDDLILFHARFVLGDRVGVGKHIGIESRVLKIFGPDSTSAHRLGKIAIFTQVIENSVDCDLDVMVSDLAPVDLLIQRAGRLCRHVRDAAGNRAEVNGRGTPKLWLFSPEFADAPESNWIGTPMPGTAAVYPDHGRLWLTAKLLRESGKFAMPDDARALIEGVYGEDADTSIPTAFQSKTNKAEGDKSAKQTVASANAIKLEKGYEDEGFDPWDDALTPTRLEDQPSITLRLARWEDGEVKPWISTEKFVWELSQVSVRVSLFAEEVAFDDPAMREEVERCRQEMPDKGKWSKLLVLRLENGVWTGQGKNRCGETVTLSYDPRMGLRKV
jgi:CRISPR-associated endonuclease/helicase Cas3